MKKYTRYTQFVHHIYAQKICNILVIKTNNSLHIIFFKAAMVILVSSCVKPYEPVINEVDAVKYVVTGQVNKGEEYQFVNISTTSPVGKPRYIPVLGCNVRIIDSKGRQYSATGMEDGNYKAYIPENEIKEGNSFMVDILFGDGTHIISDFDTITDCPPVDSIYYSFTELPSNNPYFSIKGIQFYVDLDAVGYDGRYFRWEVLETWEFRAVYPIEWVYDGKVHHIIPPDYSRKICWKTTQPNNVFALSTVNLSQNRYKAYPLHFIDNKTSPRILYGTSLLLKQYSLSKSAFEYWEKIRVNNNQQGGLYEKQPMVSKGNLHDISNPNRQVLGFFGASTVSSKRIFIKDIENLPSEYDPGCNIDGEKPLNTLKGVQPPYPVYLYATPGYGYLNIILPNYCYDCRAAGGDTIKPDFWPY